MYSCFGLVYHYKPVLFCSMWELFPPHSLSCWRPGTRTYSPGCSYYLPQSLLQSNFSVNICGSKLFEASLCKLSQPLKGSCPSPTRSWPHHRKHTLFLSSSHTLPHPFKVSPAIVGRSLTIIRRFC